MTPKPRDHRSDWRDIAIIAPGLILAFVEMAFPSLSTGMRIAFMVSQTFAWMPIFLKMPPEGRLLTSLMAAGFTLLALAFWLGSDWLAHRMPDRNIDLVAPVFFYFVASTPWLIYFRHFSNALTHDRSENSPSQVFDRRRD